MTEGRSFRELNSWIKRRELRLRIESLVRNFPKEEQYRLTDQIIRSSRSITANIAEGHGLYHYQENIQYCRRSRGSATETLDHLVVALDNGYLEKDEFDELYSECESIIKILNGYIKYLQAQKIKG